MRERDDRLRPFVLLALGLSIVLLPLAAPLAYIGADGANASGARVFLPDVAFAAVTLLALVVTIRGGLRAFPATIAIAGVALAMLAVSVVLHPTARGADLAIHFALGLGLAGAIASVRRATDLAFILGAIAVSVAMQTALAVAQTYRGGPLGLVWLGETPDALYQVGTSLAPRGTMHNANVLAAFGLIAAAACIAAGARAHRPVPWILAAGAAIVPVGMTYSRDALVALGIGLLALAPAAIRGSRVHRLALVALILGSGVPASLSGDGWTARAGSTISRVPDRPLLIAQALPIIAEHPLVGVGPSLYGDALHERERRVPGSIQVDQPPHSVPVIVAAEAGIPAGAAILAAVVVAGWRALAAGGVATAAFGMFLPFFLNDLFPYTFAQGPALLGLWLGLVAALARRAA